MSRHPAWLFLAAAVLAGGCSSDGGPRPIADYKRSVSKSSLDVPPDLSVPQSTDLMDIPQAGGHQQTALLPQSDSVHIGHSGNIRWLVINAPAERVWPQVLGFFRDQGLEVKVEEPQAGIAETAWLENRADIPTGFIQGAISQVLPGAYSAPTRDKFRVRLERGTEPGTTELYLTHYGIEQVSRGEDELIWQRRPTDTELINEMLNRLLVYVGIPRQQATAMVAQASPESGTRARLEGDALLVAEPFPRAWRRIGVALDRVGLLVEDRDRSAGVYYVRYTDELAEASAGEEGMFSGWFSEDKAPAERKFRVMLTRGGEVTPVRVTSDNDSASRERIQDLLKRLQEELR
jgi:outer membrane protein assembly factor BamC